jgi:hypothetical protein
VGVPLHSTVVRALRTAGNRVGSRPVDTRDLLVALMIEDSSGHWDRIWLHCGDAEAIAGKIALDPGGASSAVWEGIPLTDSCAAVLEISGRLAQRYNMHPLPAGILALGLVADDSTAAAQALRDGLGRDELLGFLQSEILGVSLSGLDQVLPTIVAMVHRSPNTGQPPQAAAPQVAPAPSGYVYCAHCGGTPAAPVNIRGHSGFLFWMVLHRMPGPFCRDCGLATYRRMTIESVWLGWWSPFSLFINPITMLINLSAYGEISRLPPPIPGMPGQPMDPGKTLFRRFGAIGFLIPVLILSWFFVILPLISS